MEFRSEAAVTHETVLENWGAEGGAADLDGSGSVDGADLAHALAAQLWGGFTDGGGGTVEVPLLVAGTGFAGDTAQPDSVGESDSPGFEAQAIARWDFVPNQIMTQEFGVGVVAFHAYGIDRVDFSLDGGPWTSVAAPSLNPHSQVEEYWVRVDPDLLESGLAEIRAIVYPTVGIPRVLGGALSGAAFERGEHSMPVWIERDGALDSMVSYVSPEGSDSTGDGTQEWPFATIMRAAKQLESIGNGDAGGGNVMLLPGEHGYGGYQYSLRTNVERGWITIRPAPGVASEDAPIVSGQTGGTRMSLVRFADVTFRPSGATNTIILSNNGDVRRLWLDGCRLFGVGPFVAGDWQNGFREVYATGTYITDCQNGLWGAELQRGVSIGNISADAFTNGRLVLNSTVDRIERGVTDFHPDFFMIYDTPGTPIENIIMFGCSGGSHMNTQGPFSKLNPLFDIAMVGVSFDNTNMNTVFKAFQFGGPVRHMLIQDCRMFGSALWRVDDPGFSLQDVVIRSSEWTSETIWPGHLPGLAYVD